MENTNKKTNIKPKKRAQGNKKEKSETKERQSTTCCEKPDFSLPSEMFINNNSEKTVYDLILANLITLSAVFLSMFVPVVSIALPFLVFIYLEIGLWGFVLKKERGQYCKYEEIFVSLKKYIKIFCTAVIKIFLTLFWSVFFIVPGVVCLLNYSFSGLILYESPDLDVRGVLMLSKELASGYRLKICYWALLGLASVCSVMTIVFSLLIFFDVFLFVPSAVYIVLILMAGVLDFVLLVMPLMQLVITDYYLISKNDKQRKC